MEPTNRLLNTWELVDETNKLPDTHEMKSLILKALGISQRLYRPQSIFGARVHSRLPISGTMHRNNAQLMLEQIDNEETKKTFKEIYENLEE